MMKRTKMLQFLLLISFIGSTAALNAQDQALTLLGRWGLGHCNALFYRGGYAFAGNGAYLEVFQKQTDKYVKIDSLIMPGSVQDIWVQSGAVHVYVACGKAGLQVVHFNGTNFSGIIGSAETDGYASGVAQYGNYAYVADGGNGLIIYNIGIPSNPQYRGRVNISGYARDVYIANDSTALVAGDSAGLFSVDIKNSTSPAVLDSIAFDLPFIGYPDLKPVVYNVLTRDTVAFVAAGWGGMRTVDIRNPNTIHDKQIGLWVDTSPVEVRDVFVSGQNAYLACGEKGMYAPIDVSDPATVMGGPTRLPLDTEGIATKIFIAQDTAWIADGFNGLLMADVDLLKQPSMIDSFETADYSFDVLIDGQTAYLAVGKSGVNSFDLDFSSPRPDTLRLTVERSWNTAGEARGLAKAGNYLYVADGSRGMARIDLASPQNPPAGPYFQSADTMYALAVSGSYAFLASGTDGMRIANISGSISEIPGSPFRPAGASGSALSIHVEEELAYVGFSNGVYVYQITGLASNNITNVSLLSSLSTDWPVWGIDVLGDTVFAANDQSGLRLWNRNAGTSETINTSGKCTDVHVKGRTVYLTDTEMGLAVYDISRIGSPELVETYSTGSIPMGLAVSSNKICIADNGDGLYILESEIKPKMRVVPGLLDFGPVPLGQKRPMILWIYNEGNALLEGTISVPPRVAGEFHFSTSDIRVPPNDTLRIEVIFEPIYPYPISGTGTSATINSNDPDTPITTLTFQWEGGPLLREFPYIPDGLTAGLWHFNEAAGAAAPLDTANGLAGINHGNPGRTASFRAGFGSAYTFDGNDWVEILYDSLLNVYDSPFTLELWFNMTQKPSTNGYFILARRGNGLTRQYELAIGDNEGVMGRVWDANGIQHTVKLGSSTGLKVNQWYHLALTWDTDSLRLYLNSVIVDRKQVRGNLRNDQTESLAIGCNSIPTATVFYYGALDEARLSRVARQTWEMNVNRSHMVLKEASLKFGNVLRNYSRRLPLFIENAGDDSLKISQIEVSDAASEVVSVNFSGLIALSPHSDTTLWVTYAPVSGTALPTGSHLNIVSSDPTYPEYKLPVSGTGVTALNPGVYAKDPFTLGLYHFEELSGSVLLDDSDRNMEGHWNGTNRPVAKFGGGLRFDGIDDLAVFPPVLDPRFEPRWGGLTVEGWFYISTMPSGNASLLRRGEGDAAQFSLTLEGPTLIGRVYNSAGQSVTVTSSSMGVLQESKWYHLAMSLDNDSLRLFVDGNEINRVKFQGTIAGKDPSTAYDTLSVLLGRDWNGDEPFSGLVDEVRFSSIGRQNWEFNVKLARIELDRSNINFGMVRPGQRRVQKIWVKNTGIDVLQIYNIFSTDTSTFKADRNNFTVQPAASELVRVVFKPKADQNYNGQLAFDTNDPSWDITYLPVYCYGTGSDTTWSGTPYGDDLFTLALYHFDEGSGTTARDTSSRQGGGEAELKNGLAWGDSGRYGHALCFEGTGDYLAFTGDPFQGLTHRDFSIELWFSMTRKPTTLTRLFQWGENNSTVIDILLHPTLGVVARVWNDAGNHMDLTTGSMAKLNIDQWYHIAFTNESYAEAEDSLRLYLNNERTDEAMWNGNLSLDQQQPMWLGDPSSSTGFAGLIDELRISRISRFPWESQVLPPDMDLMPAELSFATVLVNQSRTLRFWVNNAGDQDLNVVLRKQGSPAFSIPSADTLFTLHRNKTRQVPVTFHPVTSNQSYSGSVEVLSNDTVQPTVTIAMSGASTESKKMSEYSSDIHTIALYHFSEEAESNSVLDASGRGHHGQLYNGPSREGGFYGTGIHFDGIDDYIGIPYASDLDLNYDQQSFTIECYFKTDTVNTALMAMGYDNVGYSLNYGIFINGEGRISIPYFGQGGKNVSDNSWHHMAFVYSHITKTGTLYLDGKSQWTASKQTSGTPAVSRPLIIGAVETGEQTYGRYFKGSLDEIRLSSIAREIWEFQFVEYGLEITASTPSQAIHGQDYTLTLHVPVGLEVPSNKVTLFYRSGGSVQYSSVTASSVDDSTFLSTIPGDSITLNGIEYYFRAISNNDTITLPKLDPQNNPYGARVRSNTPVKAPFEFRHQQFRIFSIPYDLDTKTVAAALEDDLGGYDPYQWRLFWFRRRDATYVDYNPVTAEDPNYFRLDPGRAFFMITHMNQSFSIDHFQTIPTDSSYQLRLGPATLDTLSMELIPGWNMIGNPFPFDVAWNDCAVSDPSVTTLYHFDGKGFVMDWPKLEAWGGYFICNQDTQAVTLTIPPRRMVSAEEQSSLKKGVLTNLDSDEWMIEFSVKSDAVHNLKNFAGVRSGARQTWDPWDRPEPPPIGDYISLHFPHDDWNLYNGKYAADIRPTGEMGYIWNMRLETPLKDTGMTIDWVIHQALPGDWKVFLLDPEEGVSYDLLGGSQFRIKSGKEGLYRSFKLLVGTESFVQNHNDGISLEPVEFRLTQNYPNPFNMQTRIQYSLPRKGEVQLIIYNMLGQEVRRVFDGVQKAGHYELIWDGLDSAGRMVSSGMYICRLQAAGKTAIRKMVLIK